MATTDDRQATYFHATMYAFNDDACANIMTRFEREMGDPDARLRYDAIGSNFCVLCPSRLGTIANEKLQNIIQEFVSSELDAAAEGHAPNIYPLEGADHSWSHKSRQQRERSTSFLESHRCKTHLFLIESPSKDLIRFFHLHDLPGSLLRRLLCPPRKRFLKLISTGSTARVVRPNLSGDYEYWRTPGSKIVEVPHEQKALVNKPFPVLHDTRNRVLTIRTNLQDESKPHREETAVSLWLEELGSASRVEPDTQPEIPKGAKSSLNDLSNVSRRSRVPKGYELFPTNTTVIDSDDDDDFQSAVSRLDKLSIGSGEAQHFLRNPDAVVDAGLRDPLPGPSVLGKSSVPSSLKETITRSDPSAYAFPDQFPSFGREFSVVDQQGLTADISSMAKWQVEHSTNSTKARKKPVTLRSNYTRSVVAARSEPCIPSASGGLCSVGPQNVEPGWASKRVAAEMPQGKMIDFDDKTCVVQRDLPPSKDANSVNAVVGDPAAPATDLDLSSSSDDDIIERTRAPSPSFAICKNTMRQKAKANSKKRPGSQKVAALDAREELPLPSPPHKPSPQPQPDHRNDKRRDAHQDQTDPVVELLQNWQQEALAAQAETLPDPPCMLFVQIGLILLRHKNDKLGIRNLTLKELNAEFSGINDPLVTPNFLTRLTTSSVDVDHLMRLNTAESVEKVKPEMLYMINIHETGTGSEFTVLVPAHDKKAYTIRPLTVVLSEAFLHHPAHNFDARMLLKKTQAAEGEYQTPVLAAVETFIMSMRTIQETPSFEAELSSSCFSVERVLCERIYSSSKQGCDMKMNVVEIQDLQLVSENADPEKVNYNMRAMAGAYDYMVEQQRLWWEVNFEIANLAHAAFLPADVDWINCVVRCADGVGFSNKGPFAKVETPTLTNEETEQPFW